ncbi:MAG: hypothetical protein ABIA77_02995 [Candidatus Omnitrophota bacterium]
MKAMILFSYAIGVIGIFLFSRRILKYSPVASAVTSTFFIFNSFIPFQINTGNTRDQGWLYLPLITLTLFLSKKNRRCILYCAALIVLLLFNGFNLYLAPMFLFLFIFAAVDDISGKQNRILNTKALLPRLLWVTAIAFFLGAAKIFPLLELLSVNIRGFQNYMDSAGTAMTFQKMFLAFFSRGPYAVGNETIMGPNGLGMSSVMYFGPIPGMLFILSLVLCFKKMWKFFLIMLIFLCLCMANNSPVDIFYPLWHLPLFNSIREVARYFSFPVVFMASTIAGAAFSSRLFTAMTRQMRFFVCAAALVGAINMFAANSEYFRFAGAYQDDIPRLRLTEDFFTVKSMDLPVRRFPGLQDRQKNWTPRQREEMSAGLQYYVLRQNIGLLNWFGNIELPENASPAYRVLRGYGDYWKDFRRDISNNNGIFRNNNYKGETYFKTHKENRVNKIKWAANRITVDIEAYLPDILVVNQNYDRDWHSKTGEVINMDGLLGIHVNSPCKGEITFRYRPLTFYCGLAVSLVGLMICLLFFFKRTTRNEV